MGSSFGTAVFGTMYANFLAPRLTAALATSPGVSPKVATDPTELQKLAWRARSPCAHACERSTRCSLRRYRSRVLRFIRLSDAFRYKLAATVRARQRAPIGGSRSGSSWRTRGHGWTNRSSGRCWRLSSDCGRLRARRTMLRRACRWSTSPSHTELPSTGRERCCRRGSGKLGPGAEAGPDLPHLLNYPDRSSTFRAMHCGQVGTASKGHPEALGAHRVLRLDQVNQILVHGQPCMKALLLTLGGVLAILRSALPVR